MDEQIQDKSTFWLLLEVVFRIKPYLLKVADAHNLTILQLHILGALEPGKAYPMNSLAVRLHCDASNITGLVDRMTTLKLVERVECEKDRRIKMVQLTSQGEALHKTIMQEITSMCQQELAKCLTKSEQDQLHAVLIKLLVAYTEGCPEKPQLNK